jgi:4-hydroxyacetophenone monooxygenase
LNDLQIRATPDAASPLPIRDHAALSAALRDSSPQLLLMVLVHLTGDLALFDRIAPHIKHPWEGLTKLPDDLDQALRQQLFDVLTADPQPARKPVPKALLQKMMSACVAEPVTDEFIPMLIEQCGFELEAGGAPPRRKPPAGFKVAIIGAGLSGIAAALKLGEAGYDYVVFDRNSEVGGVWWENTYPGVGVDTPSHFYSYSFDINPAWPKYFSNGPSLMAYLKGVVDKNALRAKIRFETEVTACAYDDANHRWRVDSRDRKSGAARGEEFDAVISAGGLFNHPSRPDIPGLDDFAGPVVHTATWDGEVELRDKRVALIGTGASAIQVGPAIVGEVGSLTVFQRTPPYLLVRNDFRASPAVPEGMIWLQKHVPHYARWLRFYTYWSAADTCTYGLVKVDPDWPHQHESISPQNALYRDRALAGMRAKLAERPDLLEKVTPKYPIMGKRILQESNWCDMLKSPNCTLITERIERATEAGLTTADGQQVEVDVIVLATGFQMTKILDHIAVTGADGVELKEVWKDEDLRAYYATMIPGFPNYFMIGGPNGGATHGAGVNLYSEAQVNYILECLDMLFETGAAALSPKIEAHDAYNERLDKMLSGMIWNHPSVSTYYKNSKGRNFISWPWRIVDFWWKMRAPERDDFILTRARSHAHAE